MSQSFAVIGTIPTPLCSCWNLPCLVGPLSSTGPRLALGCCSFTVPIWAPDGQQKPLSRTAEMLGTTRTLPVTSKTVILKGDKHVCSLQPSTAAFQKIVYFPETGPILHIRKNISFGPLWWQTARALRTSSRGLMASLLSCEIRVW